MKKNTKIINVHDFFYLSCSIDCHLGYRQLSCTRRHVNNCAPFPESCHNMVSYEELEKF